MNQRQHKALVVTSESSAMVLKSQNIYYLPHVSTALSALVIFAPLLIAYTWEAGVLCPWSALGSLLVSSPFLTLSPQGGTILQ